MQSTETMAFEEKLEYLGIHNTKEVMWNLTPAELYEEALASGEGSLTDTGALMCDTGKFTGRSPKDRFIVKDDYTNDDVWWGDINLPFDPKKFDALMKKLVDNLAGKKLYVRDAYAGAYDKYRISLRVVNTKAWHNLFCHNMFLRPEPADLEGFDPEFTIINDPDFFCDDPEAYGTRAGNFAVINFTRKIIIIGGTGYAGEMKKGIFSVLNYALPKEHEGRVLPMHCSSNIGKKGDTSIFFGLSGTGKTTLSADPDRQLIGDDEHAWTQESVYNFEGGCYAKVIDLSREKEPQIWDAIKYGAIVENTRFIPNTRTVDYANIEVTQNTRTAYPIDHIENIAVPSIGGIPNNIFFLTCDAYGVLPAISKLDKGQAMYQFISGYTAKVAGTEAGVTEPQAVFSACFGAPFLPSHPTVYAEMLGNKMEDSNVNVWLINTGWQGGVYGVGKRISLKYTRAMITAALEGDLNNVGYRKHSIFGVEIPNSCPNVPREVLSPRGMWGNSEAYYKQCNILANMFVKNFKQFEEYANEEIMSGSPTPTEDY